MEICLLGTGTAVPIQQHSPSGLIVKADGQCLLFDIGPGTLGRLHLAEVDYDQINHLLLSHFHPDHTLDLATLLLVFNYAPGAERTIPFPITGCRGLEEFYKRMVDLYPEIAPAGYKLQLHEVYQDEFSIGKLKIKCAPTAHTPDSVAYRLEEGTRSIVYSGDATLRGELVQLAEGADVLISECSFPSGWETQDHLNADTLAEIAQRARVKSLILVHSYPPALAVDLVGQIREHYRGKVQMGVDGLRLSV
jgi:ribonuclease BN (tRNA processing enzyme)